MPVYPTGRTERLTVFPVLEIHDLLCQHQTRAGLTALISNANANASPRILEMVCVGRPRIGAVGTDSSKNCVLYAVGRIKMVMA